MMISQGVSSFLLRWVEGPNVPNGQNDCDGRDGSDGPAISMWVGGGDSDPTTPIQPTHTAPSHTTAPNRLPLCCQDSSFWMEKHLQSIYSSMHHTILALSNAKTY